MSTLLLHVCCGPCTAWPVPALKEEGLTVEGYFFNPNIHPFSEYLRRSEALTLYQPRIDIPLAYADHYRPEDYFRAVLGNGAGLQDRCRRCYELRLRETAREAGRRGSDAFSTTLLFSVYQKHDLLREVGERIAVEESVPFLYRDLRPGWKEGGRRYGESGLYRQNYCGCLFSEKERIERRSRRPETLRKEAQSRRP